MQKFLILALCVVAASAASVGKVVHSTRTAIAPLGIVNPVTRCGGVGTFIQLRVSNCEGICELTPGTPYTIESDFIPSSSSPSLHIRVTINVFGFDTEIVSFDLPNSSVQPGLVYTVTFQMTPNDILGGQLVTLTSYITHSGGANPGLLEVCIENDVRIKI